MERQDTRRAVELGDGVIVQDLNLFGDPTLWSGRVEDVVRFSEPYEGASYLVRNAEDGTREWIDDSQVVCFAEDAREILDVRFEVVR